MRPHLHIQVADLLQQFTSTSPGYGALFAPECSGNHRLPLYSHQKRCREDNFCCVDAVLIGPAKTVVAVIEIEHSGIPKPALLGGKLFPIALCRYLNHQAIGLLPLDEYLTFIQVVNLACLKPGSKKVAQYSSFQQEVRNQVPVGSVANYYLIAGFADDFDPGARGAVSLCAALAALSK